MFSQPAEKWCLVKLSCLFFPPLLHSGCRTITVTRYAVLCHVNIVTLLDTMVYSVAMTS